MGRVLRTKETMPDFLKWCRVTRHPLVFRGLTGSQRTPGNGASHPQLKIMDNIIDVIIMCEHDINQCYKEYSRLVY